jgi:hypothetical protein
VRSIVEFSVQRHLLALMFLADSSVAGLGSQRVNDAVRSSRYIASNDK